MTPLLAAKIEHVLSTLFDLQQRELKLIKTRDSSDPHWRNSAALCDAAALIKTKWRAEIEALSSGQGTE